MARIAIAGVFAVVAGVFLTLPGCQTNKEAAEPYPRAASRIPFAPEVRQVPIRAGVGAYPNLFTGASYAIWNPRHEAEAMMKVDMQPEKAGDEKMMAEGEKPGSPAAQDPMNAEDKQQAKMESKMDRGMEPVSARPLGLVIECRIESEFPDRSIAYDAVSLRGLEIFLRLPDGQEVLPAQKMLDGELAETPVGALRRYARTLTLYFPSGDFMVENPAANPAAKGVRLVLAGHGTEFFFEWRALPDTTVPLEARGDYQFREAAGNGYRTTKDYVKRFSHNFD